MSSSICVCGNPTPHSRTARCYSAAAASAPAAPAAARPVAAASAGRDDLVAPPNYQPSAAPRALQLFRAGLSEPIRQPVGTDAAAAAAAAAPAAVATEEMEARFVASKAAGKAAYAAGRFEESLSHFTQCMQLRPTDVIIPSNRAQALLKLSRSAEAEADASTAVSLDPTSYKAYFRRAQARFQQGKITAALEDARASAKLSSSIDVNAKAVADNLVRVLRAESIQQQSHGSSGTEAAPSSGDAASDPALAQEQRRLLATLKQTMFLAGDLGIDFLDVPVTPEPEWLLHVGMRRCMLSGVANLPRLLQPVIQVLLQGLWRGGRWLNDASYADAPTPQHYEVFVWLSRPDTAPQLKSDGRKYFEGLALGFQAVDGLASLKHPLTGHASALDISGFNPTALCLRERARCAKLCIFFFIIPPFSLSLSLSLSLFSCNVIRNSCSFSTPLLDFAACAACLLSAKTRYPPLSRWSLQ